MPARRLTPEMVGVKTKRPLPPAPDEPMKVNFNDLPTRTIARIEQMAGVSMARWQLADSNAQQLAAVAAVMYDADMDAALEESPRSLARYIQVVEDDEDTDDDSPNS
jgi:hypothetical protein